MPWKQFWKRDARQDAEAATLPAPKEDVQLATDPPPPGGQNITSGQPRTLPPHMQKIVAERRRPTNPRPLDPTQRLARLKQQRLAMLFDVEQGELAKDEENPWTQRIALLTEAMATVTADQLTMRERLPQPTYALPAVPISEIATGTAQPFQISFTIGAILFVYREELDWSERGHQLALPELVRMQGDPGAVIPADTPHSIREALLAHLAQSLDIFATALRDRRLEDEPLPEHVTLADLAKPSAEMGGWLDWHGRSPIAASRAAEELRLRREEQRLLDERAREAEERHRHAERLPIARRRLADIDTEIATAEAELQRSNLH